MPAPFTIYEAEVAVYAADRLGQVAGDLLFEVEGVLEGLSLEVAYATRRIEAHGEPYVRRYHEDEEHKLVLRDLHRVRRLDSRVFTPARNQSVILVARFIDGATGAWMKRTYFGGKFSGQQIALDPVAAVSLPFEAARMSESSGLAEPPALTPSAIGTVRYVDAFGTVALYTYDFDTHALAALDASLLAGRAAIAEAGGAIRISFAGVDAVVITSDGIACKAFSAVGGTSPIQTAAVPRLEFWDAFSRMAVVTAAGELAVTNAAEVDAAPSGVNDFSWAPGGGWAASFAPDGLRALEILETDTLP